MHDSKTSAKFSEKISAKVSANSSATVLPAGDPSQAARAHKHKVQIEITALRHTSRSLRLWIFCRRTPCYRAQACRGEPRDCLARYAPLVPDDVREWIEAGSQAGDAGCNPGATFDEHDEEMLEAVMEWRERVQRACAPE